MCAQYARTTSYYYRQMVFAPRNAFTVFRPTNRPSVIIIPTCNEHVPVCCVIRTQTYTLSPQKKKPKRNKEKISKRRRGAEVGVDLFTYNILYTYCVTKKLYFSRSKATIVFAGRLTYLYNMIRTSAQAIYYINTHTYTRGVVNVYVYVYSNIVCSLASTCSSCARMLRVYTHNIILVHIVYVHTCCASLCCILHLYNIRTGNPSLSTEYMRQPTHSVFSTTVMQLR